MTEGIAAAAIGTAWHALSVEEALAGQKVEPGSGLTSAEVTARRAQYGPNRFAEQKPEPRLRAFLRQYADAMQIVLLVAGILSIYPVGQVSTGVMLLLLTLLNAYLGLSQEGKAAAAVAALQKMMVVKSRVRRDGELVEIPAEELVPGDIVAFEAGDLVTADGRILAAATLEIDEAALTGESLPVVKGRRSRGCRRAARRPPRHGLHEHERDPGLGAVGRDGDRDGHRGRPHLRDAPGRQGAGDAR